MKKKLKFTTLGGGSYATAIAQTLASNGYAVSMLVRRSSVVSSINKGHLNKDYFPDFFLDRKISAHRDPRKALQDSDVLIISVPVSKVRILLKKISKHIKKELVIINTSKGIENSEGLLMHQLIKQILPDNKKVFSISGPSFAREMMEEKATSLTLAGEGVALRGELAQCFKNDWLKIDESSDIISVELLGSCKNILAIVAGVCVGSNQGSNALSTALTRGIIDINTLVSKLGGNSNSFISYAGIGDLMLTCYGNLSRNRRFGLYIGEGLSVDEACEKVQNVVEGLNTYHSIKDICARNDIDLSLIKLLTDIFDSSKSIDQSFKDFFSSF